ncbi:hypothetical protein ACX80I_16595 [Arthrobacter sp. MDT3-44]
MCLYSDDAVLIALLTRGLVETAVREWRAGGAPLPVPTATVRMASWRAGRFGMDGKLLLRRGELGDVVSEAVRVTNLARGGIAEHHEAARRPARRSLVRTGGWGRASSS